MFYCLLNILYHLHAFQWSYFILKQPTQQHHHHHNHHHICSHKKQHRCYEMNEQLFLWFTQLLCHRTLINISYILYFHDVVFFIDSLICLFVFISRVNTFSCCSSTLKKNRKYNTNKQTKIFFVIHLSERNFCLLLVDTSFQATYFMLFVSMAVHFLFSFLNNDLTKCSVECFAVFLLFLFSHSPSLCLSICIFLLSLSHCCN